MQLMPVCVPPPPWVAVLCALLQPARTSTWATTAFSRCRVDPGHPCLLTGERPAIYDRAARGVCVGFRPSSCIAATLSCQQIPANISPVLNNCMQQLVLPLVVVFPTSTTVDPATTRQLAAAAGMLRLHDNAAFLPGYTLQDGKPHLLDAPVSGGVVAAGEFQVSVCVALPVCFCVAH